MGTQAGVLGDIAMMRRELRDRGSPHLPLLRVGVLRPLADIGLDLLIIVATIAWTWHQPWLLPLALLVIGNRQRALGNILHDASHRDLSRRRWVNDLVAGWLLAPLLFLDLTRYRDAHFAHHLHLGTPGQDPDFMAPMPVAPHTWTQAVRHQLCSTAAWRGSVAGHLAEKSLGIRARARIVAWWVTCLLALTWLVGWQPALLAFALWLAARATVFHVITTFREMCDHHGLCPGGVYSFTRDITGHGLWRLLVHPRNNAYHLTHYLLPAIPYDRLPQAQRLFAQLPSYRQHGVVGHRYLSGQGAAATSWQSALHTEAVAPSRQDRSRTRSHGQAAGGGAL